MLFLPGASGHGSFWDPVRALLPQGLRGETLDWTAVRPGWLMEGNLTSDYQVQSNVIPRGTLRTRHADLADFMVELASNGDWIHQFPAIARREPPSATAPAEVLKELA